MLSLLNQFRDPLSYHKGLVRMYRVRRRMLFDIGWHIEGSRSLIRRC